MNRLKPATGASFGANAYADGLTCARITAIKLLSEK